jgi:hypothetical protein
MAGWLLIYTHLCIFCSCTSRIRPLCPLHSFMVHIANETPLSTIFAGHFCVPQDPVDLDVMSDWLRLLLSS